MQGAVGCVLLLILDLVVFTPLWDFHVSMEQKIIVAEKTLIRNLVNLQRKEAVEAGYEKFRPFVRHAGTDEEENAALLSEMERLARSHQVVLVDMKPRETIPREFHKEYVAELDAEAEMANLVNFIYQLEQSVQLVRVSNVTLSAKEAKSTFVKAKITVTKTALLGDS